MDPDILNIQFGRNRDIRPNWQMATHTHTHTHPAQTSEIHKVGAYWKRNNGILE